MADFYTSKDDAITHSAIAHELLKKIVIELGTKEFRGGYQKPIINNGTTYMDYITDSRAEYIQGVESLADLLLPQYDEEMKKIAEQYEEEVREMEEVLENKDIKMGDKEHIDLIRNKLRLARILFRELNLLLKRTNYLKANAYSEEMEDEDE